ncbi:glycosyltransferase [Heliobacterium gestii]|uniref:Glycosyltransferase n=1 Tax=Heliomicrobium gestii TaxID=2699 RepID=A0A845L908_HELGE|nr:glycosyltransferase family 1 protein [Heliomicrobium gestii]MBM7866598.1 glycosyltransferase involved in cell wall biosynthesis [Heliomicrobium gestii]MZP43122.1 glycosyltransferase [Heliomicrobium gestii]
MRIGIDARYGLVSKRRGIGEYIHHLLEHYPRLLESDWEITLFLDSQADPAEIEYFSKFGCYRIRTLATSPMVLWEQWALPNAAKQEGLALLHCPANMAPFIKPCPVVTTIHDVIEFRRNTFQDERLSLRHRMSRLYRMGLLPKTAENSERIITDSYFSRSDISDVLKGSDEKIRVVYCGADVEWYQSDEKEGIFFTDKWNGLSKRNYIFALGALDKRKNTRALIQAFCKARSDFRSDIELVITGIERPDAFADCQVEGVRLLDFVTREELRELYRNALFFVYPSLYEGFGLPVIEAMLSGTPVTCSKTTSVGEIAKGNALLFDPTDIDDMASKIRLMAEDELLRRERIETGFRYARQFTWEKAASETLSVYKEVLAACKC